MYLPDTHDELTSLGACLEVQLEALRTSAHGLDDEQARLTPLRSALSIGGILKHCCFVMKGSLMGAGILSSDRVDEDFYASFALADDESLTDVLGRFDALREPYLTMCREGDLDAVLPVGPMPWYQLDEARPATLRYLYVAHIEEFARHAGHADIIREQIDGATSLELAYAVQGWPGNEFVTPWTRSR